MKIEQLISEALTFKQARPYMKAWDPNFHKAVFEREPRTDKGARRIYLPFETDSTKPINIPDQLQQYLRTAIPNKPYMTDADVYMQGLAYEVANPSRKLGIGKMLARSLASESDPDRKAELQDIKKTFDVDPQRAATRKPDKLIVISRHPYDVAGMSTDRGWSSCMNIVDGVNKRYVLRDVKQGSIIAYLIQSDDMNIRKPLARILIRPYGQIGKPKNIAMMADRVYGTAPASFKTQVDAWVDKNYNQDKTGLFCVKPGLYIDNAPRRVMLLSDDALKSYTPKQVIAYLESDIDEVESKYARVAKVRPDADAILAQVTLKGNLGAAKYIKQSPSLAMFQKMADKFDGVKVLKHIQNPSEDIIAWSIKRDPRALAYVKNRSEKQNQDLSKLISEKPNLVLIMSDPQASHVNAALQAAKSKDLIKDIFNAHPTLINIKHIAKLIKKVPEILFSLNDPDKSLVSTAVRAAKEEWIIQELFELYYAMISLEDKVHVFKRALSGDIDIDLDEIDEIFSQRDIRNMISKYPELKSDYHN